MTTTSTAENPAGRAGERAGEKEKAEKRRALGRGLESLLPGPRVVTGGGAAGQSSAGASKQPVPQFVRKDKAEEIVRNEGANDTSPITIQAVATEAREETEGRAAAQEFASEGAGEAGAASPGAGTAEETITIFAQAESRIPGNLVANLAIADIDKNPFQTRYVEDDEALEELADSIQANGVVQPIMVRPSDEDEGRYVLILGERRLHASRKVGKTHIPALVRRVSLQQAAEMTIIENLQREDLSPLEQAEAFRVLSRDFHLTQEEIGKRVGLSRVSVANYMRLLKLPRDVMQLLAEKKLKFAEAKELLKLNDDSQLSEAALYAVKKGLTIEQIERLVLSMTGLLDPFPGMPGQPKKKSGARWVDPNVRAAQTELERLLGMRVRIRDRKGKGKIVIEYHTVDDYERVVDALRGKK